ncbi:MAG: neurotransmitter:Na+ symporter, family, partial [Thermoplasmata archaeon]|nr:neurotransmitter:Na+ symporter, family [Thermoplasmata archaeon]
MMAGGGNGRTFVLALVGAGLAATLARFAWGSAVDGLWFLGFAAVGLFAVGLPIVLAEGALGQFRRRNAVDAYGPGAWKGLGAVAALGAVVLAALLAVLAGWSARFVVLSFSESWYDDPSRHFRLLSSGPDAVLTTLGVLAAATGVALRGTRKGSKAIVGFCAVTALILLAGLAVWGNTFPGSAAGRTAVFATDVDAVGWSLAFAGILAGLLPTLLATGVTVTLSSHLHERTLPREVTLSGVFTAIGILLATLFIAGLSSSQGTGLASGDG